jgi:hypothetical protein
MAALAGIPEFYRNEDTRTRGDEDTRRQGHKETRRRGDEEELPD